MDNLLKYIIVLALFSVWVYLIIYQVPNSADLIANIKVALTGIGTYSVAYQIDPKGPK